MAQPKFSELFEESIKQRNIEEGSDLLVQVLDVNENFVTVNAALKSDSRIPIDEFTNANKEVEVKEGDEVEVEIELLEDGRGETVLSYRNARQKRIWRAIEHAMGDNDEVVEGTIQSRVRGGFSVSMNGVRAFLPGSLADVFPISVADNMLIGKTMEFKPIKVNRRRNSVVLSRRALIEKNMQNKDAETLAALEPGARVKGRVRTVVDYGAFVEIGENVFGLLHVTDMSWRHISNVADVISVDDEVEAVVLRLDKERGRVSLGVKQLQPDPWEYFERSHPVGSRTFGKVKKIMDYGVFVEIEDQLQGLVHTSEMQWSRRNVHPSTIVSVDDEVEVMVLEIDRERRRISLGIKQCQNNPWREFETAYRKNDKLKCRVRSISEFGIFMELPGEIEGLVYLTDISYSMKGEDAIRQYQPGQEVETIILSIEAERRRIRLGIKQVDHEKFNEFANTVQKGDKLKVRIDEIQEKGAVVSVAPDNLRGFLPISEISQEHVTEIGAALKIGEERDAVLIDIDERYKRLIVSLKAKSEDVARKHQQQQQAQEKAQAQEKRQAKASSLGALVQEKLNEQSQSGAAADVAPEADSKPASDAKAKTEALAAAKPDEKPAAADAADDKADAADDAADESDAPAEGAKDA